MPTGAQVWSTAAASNNTIDTNVNWSEGMAPSQVNDSARAQMASAAMFIGDNSGTLLTSGSSSAFTVTSKQHSTAAVDGYTIAVRFHSANDPSATLNVDGVGAKAIQLYAGQALVGSEFQAGSVGRFTYTSSSTSWILNNFARPVGTPGFFATSTSSSAPAYSFAGDTDSGVYPIGPNNVGILCGGVKAADVSTSSISSVGDLIANATLFGANASGNMMATQSDQETASATSKIVSPGTQQFHPSAAKFWIMCNAAGSIKASYNVTSITDVGTGLVTITIATDFSSASYAVVTGYNFSDAATGNVAVHVLDTTQAAGSVELLAEDSAGTNIDPSNYYCAGFGDQ